MEPTIAARVNQRSRIYPVYLPALAQPWRAFSLAKVRLSSTQTPAFNTRGPFRMLLNKTDRSNLKALSETAR
jgi:hypothetical protein